jgi:GTP 3',8-cyclase
MVRDTLNRPLRDLRISVTDKCNFRCPYCMPIEVYGEDYEFSPKAEILTFEEITRLTALFAKAGARKVRITGGEPLIRKGLPVLIGALAGVPGVEDLTLTTNGWFLAQQAAALKAAGLRRVTVSLDSMDDAVFGRMNGRGFGVQGVLDGIAAAQAAGLTPVKVNAVMKRSENYEAIVGLAEHFRGTGVIVRFIEYMDVGNKNGWRLDEVIPSAELIGEIHKRWPLEPVEPNYRGEVAERYRYADGQGEIGVISSITQPFCGDCSRGRLTTDGRFVTCLFAAGGRNLRDPMRAGASDAELLGLIEDTWGRRTDRYSEERTANTPLRPRRKIEMYRIGG